MSAFSPVNLEIAEQVQPYMIYQRVTLVSPREFYGFRIDYGYGYLLRRLRVRWPTIAAGPALAPSLSFEIFSKGSIKARQSQPIPFSLNSTPTDRGLGYTSPVGPPLADAAAIPGSFKILNWLFPYGSTIELHITGQTGGAPAYVDVVYDGYYIPEESLALWGQQ